MAFFTYKDINNANLLRPWLLKVKRNDPPVSKHSYIYSEHFSEDCFIWCVGGRRHLNCKIQFFTGGKAKAFFAQLHMRPQRVKSTCTLTYKELPYFKIYSKNSARVALLTWFSQLCVHCSLFFCLLWGSFSSIFVCALGVGFRPQSPWWGPLLEEGFAE